MQQQVQVQPSWLVPPWGDPKWSHPLTHCSNIFDRRQFRIPPNQVAKHRDQEHYQAWGRQVLGQSTCVHQQLLQVQVQVQVRAQVVQGEGEEEGTEGLEEQGGQQVLHLHLRPWQLHALHGSTLQPHEPWRAHLHLHQFLPLWHPWKNHQKVQSQSP